MIETTDPWQEKFEQYLKLRGVKKKRSLDRLTSRLAGLEQLFSIETTRQLSLHSIATNIENSQAFLISHHQRMNNIYAPDTIYQYHRLPGLRSILESGLKNDRLHTLYHFDLDSDSSDDEENMEQKELESLANESYTSWEHHGPNLLKEIKSHKSNLTFNPVENVPTEEASLQSLETQFCSLVKPSPAEKFKDSLKLDFIASSELDGIVDSRFYKNNLSTIITSSLGEKILVVGELSQLYFYLFDPLSHVPQKSPSLCINIEPPVTTPEQFRGLTWEFNPHTVNFMKTTSGWSNHEILVVCGDDGQILMWESDSIIYHMSSSGMKTLNYSKAKPDFKLSVPASAWGVDLASLKDSKDHVHKIAFVSYNSRKVELFYFDTQNEEFVSLCTDLVPHNVPEASFLCYLETEGKHEAIVSLVSISSDILTYSFSWIMDHISGRPDVISIKMNIILNFRLEYENWTSKPIEATYFRKVHSLEELTGDFSSKLAVTEAKVLRESMALDSVKPDIKFSSSLGIAAAWQVFCPSVVKLNDRSPEEEKQEVVVRKRDSQYNSIAQAYKKYKTSTFSPVEKALALKFLAISSRCEIALYRANTLLCCANTSDVFTTTPKLPEEAHFSNRILISLVIPELSCFIAATQLGSVAIMRLCQYRGVYSMRQEHIFPHFSAYTNIEGLGRPLIGLAAKKMSTSDVNSRFYLYLLYSNGHVITYQLLDNWSELETLSI